MILLDTPVPVARALVSRKGSREYTTLEADIHEADAEHSSATREVMPSSPPLCVTTLRPR